MAICISGAEGPMGINAVIQLQRQWLAALPTHGNFITTPNSSPWDWLIPQNNNLWQGQDEVNNPYPNGFRIPTQAEMNAECASWVSQKNTGAFASPLKFTTAGVRKNDGTLGWVSPYGY